MTAKSEFTGLSNTDGLEALLLNRVPPQGRDTERGVLGAIVLDKDAFLTVGDFLKAEMFYEKRHRVIFQACKHLFQNNQPIDLITVSEWLKANDYMGLIGGPMYLVELTDTVASSANLEAHARLLVQFWMKRELITACTQVVNDCYAKGDVFEIINALELSLNHINALRTSTAKELYKFVPDLMAKLRAIHERGEKIIGIPSSGIHKLEMILGGSMAGDFEIEAGPTGSGKSSFSNNVICTHLHLNEPLYDWSGEMSPEQRIIRAISLLSEIDGFEVRAGNFFSNVDQWNRVEQAVELFQEKKVFLDKGALSLSKLKSVVMNYNRLHGVKVFRFDRLGLMNFGSVPGVSSREEAKGEFCNTARFLAEALGVTITFSSQLRKEYKKNPGCKPTLDDVIGSGAVTQATTKVKLFYRPEKEGIKEIYDKQDNPISTKGLGFIIVDKNTHGRTDEVVVNFKEKLTKWGELDVIGEASQNVTSSAAVAAAGFVAADPDEDLPF